MYPPPPPPPHTQRRSRSTPSFSSTLLDSIYHSIDSNQNQNQNQTTSSTIIKKDTNTSSRIKMNLRQAVMIEDWMEKQTSTTTTSTSSSSSSSQCSSARLMLFSSTSETDQYSTTTTLNRKQTSKLKYQQKQQQNQKVRQPPIPISPGRMSRIATFLSSIFSSENVKKAKMCYVGAVQDVTFQSNSNSPPPCSTTKSCISKKTPFSSSSKRNVKRSVRFYPVSVILGEEEDSNSNSNSNSIQQQRTVLPRNNSSIKELKNINNVRGIYDDDDDDGLSYSSSDLFELDHLIGDERYQEELPVYETTSLEINKAIARNGLR